MPTLNEHIKTRHEIMQFHYRHLTELQCLIVRHIPASYKPTRPPVAQAMATCATELHMATEPLQSELKLSSSRPDRRQCRSSTYAVHQ